ncbi:MAG: 2'-5' RNA ligase family protein [Chryseobacterium sp.]|nr:MAG: 2'-5' RNA ligase family protein [Chryseobacterium sp.]
MDSTAQEFFDALRLEHFPIERNFLKAHLTLFHKLPDTIDTLKSISDLSFPAFKMQVTGLFNLGAGVAFRVEGKELGDVRKALSTAFAEHLSPQDKQGFRGHITVQNKTSPETARALLTTLSAGFVPFEINALGLDLWYYLGGPWEHKRYFPLIV